MAGTVQDEGRDAFMRGIDPRKCPYDDEARREAWMRGWYDAQREFEAN
jgi:ribosome modulation factor